MRSTVALLARRVYAQPSRSFPAAPLCRLFATERAAKIVKPGESIIVNGAPHRVGKITQGKRGKGGGFVRAVLKNLEDGQVFEKTFTSDEDVESADMEKEVCQYTWNDGQTYCFQNSLTFEEVQVQKKLIDSPQFLVEGQEVKLLKFKEKIIGVELAKLCEFEVIKIDQFDTAGGNMKATLNGGAELFVPLFIKEGMKIRVNVLEGIYVERV